MSNKVPKIRFNGYSDAWVQRKVKDIFKITRGQVLAATETSEEKSDISPFPVYSSQTKNNGLMGYYKDYLFDTAITWTTDGANAGTVSYRSGRFYSTNVNGVLISDKGYTNKAISEILNLEAWKWVSHVGNPKLMNNVMGDISIMIPSSFEEQDRLSDFLNQLDDTIALHQRKLDLLKKQKKGYLQKMFPKNGEKVPELRFTGFADDWVQRNLAELATMNARIGWQNLRTSEFLDEGDYILITGTDFKDGEIDYSNIHYVEKERFDQDKKIQVQDGSILITKDGTLGKVAYVKNLPGPATLNAGVFNVRVINSDETDSKYLFHYLKAPFLLKFADEQSTGGTIKHLNQNVLVKFPVPLPGLDEQKRIANLLESMDNLIAANQRKLDLLKEQKKGFLQNMFV